MREELIVGWTHGSHNGVANLGIFSAIDEVAGCRYFGATRQAIAVNLSDHGFGEIPDPEETVDDMASPVAVSRRGVKGLVVSIVGFEIVARAERFTLSLIHI